MALTVGIDYNYLFSSELANEAPAKRRLSLATSGGTQKNPYFFSGRLVNPKRSACLLLTLSTISRTRFFSPGELRERLLAAADPVVTADGSQLRFEVFSVCCGTYARLDLRNSAVDGDWISKGTTNVDFNAPMRAQLASVMNSENLTLRVGSDHLEIERGDHKVTERKVQLPLRWLKGFVEVQVYQSGLEPRMELPALELAKLIRTLPQQNIMQAGTISYLVPAGKSVRLSQREAPGSVAVGAVSRLKTLEPLLAFAKTVKVYGSSDAVSAFELDVPEGRFTFVLSQNAARGFSGEGQALSGLANDGSHKAVASVRGALSWQSSIDAGKLGQALALSPDIINGALQILGTRGLVGFDLESRSYFHRELPFNLDLVEELHPRMKKARQLFEEGLVRIASAKEADVEAYVKGTSGDHFVRIGADSCRCTCDWFAKNQGERGPCSHILAVEIAVQPEKVK